MSGDGALAPLDELDVVVAHWHVNAWGGAENLVTKIAESLDVNSVYTIGEPTPDSPNPYGDVDFYDVTQDLSLSWVRGIQSKMGRLFEYAIWEDVDWREYGDPDVVVTSGSTTRAVITPDDTLQINYCHSPPRWFYDLYHDRKSSPTGILVRPLLRYLRMRDVIVDVRVDGYLANSPNVARRIEKYYDRKAEILHPPIELERYRNGDDDGFYLYLGRLDVEKGVKSVINAFEVMDEQLVLAGGRGDVTQSIIEAIENADNIRYEGFVSESRKLDLLASCTAVIFNARNEDFGIVPIEANASGKPCLARNEGFPATFVRDGVNGFLHDGTATGIQLAVERSKKTPLRIDPGEFVGEFSMGYFTDSLRTFIRDEFEAFQSRFARTPAIHE